MAGRRGGHRTCRVLLDRRIFHPTHDPPPLAIVEQRDAVDATDVRLATFSAGGREAAPHMDHVA